MKIKTSAFKITNEKRTVERKRLFGRGGVRFLKKITHNGVITWDFLGITWTRIKTKTVEINFSKKPILIFDMSWGGGTESYIEQFISDAVKNNTVIRIQRWDKRFRATIFTKDEKYIIIKRRLNKLLAAFNDILFSEIIVNHLIGWPDLQKTTDTIAAMKSRADKMTFRAHDYWPLCPSITLLSENKNFCGLPKSDKCAGCYMKSGRYGYNRKYKTVEKWRALWEKFFKNAIDYTIAPSDCVKKMFLQVYPFMDIRAVPHVVAPLRKPKIAKHKGINIAVIGEISAHKGAAIISEINKIAPKNFKIMIIGKDAAKMGVENTGKYERDELPALLEKHNIDMIFIPSIWPETFSYTTSEAIEMDMPVACFNLGAPAERVGKYKRGLVIDKIDAKYALEKIIKFLK